MGIVQSALHIEQWIAQYVVQPLLVLLLGIFLGKLVEQAFLAARREFRVRHPAYPFVSSLTTWTIYAGTVLYSLHTIGLLAPVLWLLLGVVVTLVAISLVLGLRDFFPNFRAHGRVKARYHAGQRVQTSFASGEVVAVQLTDTHVRTKEGEDLYIPNSALLTEKT